jgi:preprotein translocase SecF subunit
MAVTTDVQGVGVGAPQAAPRTIPFMRWRGWAFTFTMSLFFMTIVSLGVQGLNLGLDFTGGVQVEAQKETGTFDAAALRSSLKGAGFPEASVQLADDNHVALVRVGLVGNERDTQPLVNKVVSALGDGVKIEGRSAIGPQVSGELLRGGLLAALLAVVLISIYIWFRFERKFGLAVFLTTFHDVILLLGFYSVTRLTFDLTSIAAILTIAGYSVNDKVVVFDRIREMLRKHKRTPLKDVIDEAITATLSRTVVTSVTTTIGTLAILFLAGPVLFGFAAAILFGIIKGTYSSIFVAAPLLIHLPGKAPGDRIQETPAKA